jgi:hypothetical protein
MNLYKIFEILPDDKIEQAIVDYVINSWKNNPDNEFQIVNKLPNIFMIIYSTWVTEVEVENGGFNQYFYNTKGKYAIDCVHGYKQLGLNELSDIVLKAIDVYKKESSKSKIFKKLGTLFEFFESYKKTNLSQFDQPFYKLSKNASSTRIQFIRKNIEKFSVI